MEVELDNTIELYDGTSAKPLFQQLWKIIFALVDDTLSQMQDREYAQATRKRIQTNAGRLRITMDANTREIAFLLEVPSKPGEWEQVFTVTLENPEVKPSVN